MLVEHLPQVIKKQMVEKPIVKVFYVFKRCRIILRNDICSDMGITNGDIVSFLYDSKNPYLWVIRKATESGYRIRDYGKYYLSINLKLPDAIKVTEGRKTFFPGFKQYKVRESGIQIIELYTSDFLP